MVDATVHNVRYHSTVAREARADITRVLHAMSRDAGLGEDCMVATLAGGASNANYLVDNGGRRLVLRIAEQDVSRFGVDRASGAAAHRAAAAAGVAPSLAAVLLPEGHSLTAYVDSVALDAEAIRTPELLARAAELIRELHHAPPEGVAAFSVFDDIRNYTEIATRERLELPEVFPHLLSRVEDVEAAFSSSGSEPVLAHNDLVPQNFLRSDDDRLWLVDYEYSGIGNPYFDLGNFASNAELDDHLIGVLLSAYGGRGATAADRARVELMRFASALREAAWSVIAAPVLDHDWDYAAWGARYFDEAYARSSRGDFQGLVDLAGERA